MVPLNGADTGASSFTRYDSVVIGCGDDDMRASTCNVLGHDRCCILDRFRVDVYGWS